MKVETYSYFKTEGEITWKIVTSQSGNFDGWTVVVYDVTDGIREQPYRSETRACALSAKGESFEEYLKTIEKLKFKIAQNRRAGMAA